MAENFGLKIGLEGEKEFKSQLASINQTFKVLGSEMKLVDSQFEKNDIETSEKNAAGQGSRKRILFVASLYGFQYWFSLDNK